MQWRKLALYSIALTALVTLGLWLWNEINIDRCLDHGGRWNHEHHTCEGDRKDR